jgi:pantothenate kinase type III
VEKEFSELNVILTGGDGPMIAKKLQRKIFLHPELLHIGLRETLKFNAN